MNNSQYRIALDVHSAQAQVQLVARRGETGRVIRISLTERGQPYVIASGSIAEFAAMLPDGTLLKNACGIAGGEILYKLTARTTSISGVLECEIRLSDAGGSLLVSPRFSLAVYDTVYNQGDAVVQEGPSANTVKSSEPGYSQVFMWSDGNPNGENRLGYFVSLDQNKSAAFITRANGESPVVGVTAAVPGFAAAARQDKFDGNGVLAHSYEYVTMLGFAAVTDYGRCQVNAWCRPGPDGTAVPGGQGGFRVVERIDENHVTVLITVSNELETRVYDLLERKQNKLAWLTRQDIDQMLLGQYQGVEDEVQAQEDVDAVLFAVRKEGAV